MIIAVFDDRKKNRDELVGIISSWAEEKGHADVIIRQFSTIDNLRFALEDYRQPDIFFLDIMTPESTSAGFVLAEHIHSVNPQASIIFTTNSREYISNAFEISAFRYLLKPLDAARVYPALDQLYLSVSQKNRRAAVFRGFDRHRIVDYDQILKNIDEAFPHDIRRAGAAQPFSPIRDNASSYIGDISQQAKLARTLAFTNRPCHRPAYSAK